MAKAEQVALVVPCRARIDPGAFFLPPPSPWNKGRLIGQKPPLKLREVWTVRTRLQMAGNIREIALFNLAIDSKLRGCDLVRLMVRDLAHGSQVLARA